VWTGIWLGILCWLVYRHGKLSAAASPQKLTNREDVPVELVDRDGRETDHKATDKNLPPWAWPLIAFAYAVCPLDGDFIPVLGWIDDGLVACFAAYKWWTARQAQTKT
jgi:hypothetical protein